jgi:serine/threonine protein kinase
VTDFGIARITDSSKTKTGMVLGTPSYMSPEQLAGKKIDGRSDLFSLGVMLFQMSCGKLPFEGDSMAQLMFKIANEAASRHSLHQSRSARLCRGYHRQGADQGSGCALPDRRRVCPRHSDLH